jgi:hypothetical protein
MKTFLTLFLATFFSFSVQAQVFPSEIWHQGTAVLITDDTLKGLIKYDFVNDAIQVKTEDGRISAFSAQNLFFFEVFDTGIKNHRQFYALPMQVSADYLVPMLFEVLYEGRLTLLSREKIVQEGHTQAVSDQMVFPQDARLMLAFDFYFLEKNGSIKEYKPKKRKLLSIMDRKYNEVKKYIRRNNLRPDQISDLVRITAYYNALGD